MDIPSHPADVDDPTTPSPRTRRTVIAAVGLVIVLASIHLLRAAIG